MEVIVEMQPVVNEIEIGDHEVLLESNFLTPNLNKDEVVKSEPSLTAVPVHGQINVCSHCNLQFKGRNSFLTHQKRAHPNQSKGTVKCQQLQCHRTFLRIKQLVDHLVVDHHYPVETFCRNFNTNEEFLEWKEEFEATNCSQYRMTSSKKKTEVRYFNCVRSGFHTSKCTTSRKSKLSGSMKMNGHCISSMALRKQIDGTLSMECIASHYGHAVDVPRKMLSQKQKSMITQLLHLRKLEHDAIVAKVNHDLPREASIYCPVTKKDVYNTYYSVLCNRLDTQFSVISPITMWLTEREGFNVSESLLFHKGVGQKDPHNMLDDADFVVVLMTDLQRQNIHTMAQHGLCVEVSLGVCKNVYHTLITLFGLHYPNPKDTSVCTEAPLAFCVSNNNTLGVKLNFFNAIKAACGTVQVPFLMTNEYKECQEAWSEIFVDDMNDTLDLVHIISPWDVRNTIIRGVNTLVESSVHSKRICETLDDLLYTPRSDIEFGLRVEELKNTLMRKVEYQEFYSRCFVDFLEKAKESWSVSHYPNFITEVESFKQVLDSNLRRVKLTSFCNKTFGRCVSNLMKYYTSKLNVFDATFTRKRKRLTKKERTILDRKIVSVEKNLDIDSALVDQICKNILNYDYRKPFIKNPFKYMDKIKQFLGGINNFVEFKYPDVPLISKPPPGFQFQDPIPNLPKITLNKCKLTAAQRKKQERLRHIYSYESLEPLRVKKRKIMKDASCSIEVCSNLIPSEENSDVVMNVVHNEVGNTNVVMNVNHNDIENSNVDHNVVEEENTNVIMKFDHNEVEEENANVIMKFDHNEVEEENVIMKFDHNEDDYEIIDVVGLDETEEVLGLDTVVYEESNGIDIEVKMEIENQITEEYQFGEEVVISEEVVPYEPMEEDEPIFIGFVQ